MRLIPVLTAGLLLGTALSVPAQDTAKPAPAAQAKRPAAEPSPVWMKMSLVRMKVDEEGITTIDKPFAPSVSTFSDMTGTVSVTTVSVTGGKTGFVVKMTPHLNANGSLRLTGLITVTEDSGKVLDKRFDRTLPKDRKWLLIGFTNSANPDVQKKVEKGTISELPGKRIDYFLQVTPTLNK